MYLRWLHKENLNSIPYFWTSSTFGRTKITDDFFVSLQTTLRIVITFIFAAIALFVLNYAASIINSV